MASLLYTEEEVWVEAERDRGNEARTRRRW